MEGQPRDGIPYVGHTMLDKNTPLGGVFGRNQLNASVDGHTVFANKNHVTRYNQRTYVRRPPMAT